MLAMRAGRLQRFNSNPKLFAACCKMDCYALIGLLMRGGGVTQKFCESLYYALSLRKLVVQSGNDALQPQPNRR